jgi:hypothetical protein
MTMIKLAIKNALDQECIGNFVARWGMLLQVAWLAVSLVGLIPYLAFTEQRA